MCACVHVCMHVCVHVSMVGWRGWTIACQYIKTHTTAYHTHIQSHHPNVFNVHSHMCTQCRFQCKHMHVYELTMSNCFRAIVPTCSLDVCGPELVSASQANNKMSTEYKVLQQRTERALEDCEREREVSVSPTVSYCEWCQ